jgi:hypothetical protein
MINTISDFEQTYKINIGEIELSKEALGKYFSVEESYELKNIWNHYKKYRDLVWDYKEGTPNSIKNIVDIRQMNPLLLESVTMVTRTITKNL